jgi:hypothetical protein
MAPSIKSLPSTQIDFLWLQQFGTTQDDTSLGFIIDDQDNLYLTGSTAGQLGNASFGQQDGWVARLDTSGNQVWLQQYGTAQDDEFRDIDVQGEGELYLSGWLEQNPSGNPTGFPTAAAVSYDREGNFRWLAQPSFNAAWGWDIEVDASQNVILSSSNNVAKYDDLGNLLWSNSEPDSFNGTAIGAQNSLYLSRRENISKHDAAGNVLWEFANPSGTSVHDVILDVEGNALFVGRTPNSLAAPNAGGDDIWLSKYDGDGNPIWSQQFGSAADDFANSILMDASHNIYLTGRTAGDLGATNAGGQDAFVAKLTPDGDLLWINQFGTPEDDNAFYARFDSQGNLYLNGWTEGTLGDSNAGGQDAWVAQVTIYPQVPDTPEDTPLTFSESLLTEGVPNPEGIELFVSSIVASSGSITNNGDGTFTYEPLPDFNGLVELSYTVSNPSGEIVASPARSFDVIAVNDAPTGRPTYEQIGKLTASDGAAYELFGLSVAIDGNRAIVGAPNNIPFDTIGNPDESIVGPGSAYIYTFDGSTWTETAKLTPSDSKDQDLFGIVVDIKGDTALVGALNTSYYVFMFDGETWKETIRIPPLESSALAEPVLLDSHTIADGSSLYIFDGTNWVQEVSTISKGFPLVGDGNNVLTAQLKSAGGDNFSTDTDVYLYTLEQSSEEQIWVEKAQLIPSGGESGDRFGWFNADLEDDTAIVSAFLDNNENGENAGSVYVFTNDGNDWPETQQLLASDGEAFDSFGTAVALHKSTLIVGAIGADAAIEDQGSAYVYTFNGESWIETDKLSANDATEISSDLFGFSAAANENSILVGAIWDDDNGANSGSVYVFANESGEPVKISGQPEKGIALTADTSSLVDNDGLPDTSTYTYQWQQSFNSGATWNDIPEATDQTFKPGNIQTGSQLRVQVSYTDLGGTLETVNSPGVEVASYNYHSDINDDGSSDIVWRNPASGDVYVWYLENGIPIASAQLSEVLGANSSIVGIGDLDADGKEDDLVEYDSAQGKPVFKYGEYTNGELSTVDGPNAMPAVGGTWEVQGVGDFDGDRFQDDLFWFDPVSQSSSIWYTQNGQVVGGDVVEETQSLGENWSVDAVGNFDDDGLQDDLVWRNSLTGETYIWFMEGTNPTGSAELLTVDPSWMLGGASDFDGDFKPDDLIWRNMNSGQTAVWFMEGTQLVGGITDLQPAPPLEFEVSV